MIVSDPVSDVDYMIQALDMDVNERCRCEKHVTAIADYSIEYLSRILSQILLEYSWITYGIISALP